MRQCRSLTAPTLVTTFLIGCTLLKPGLARIARAESPASPAAPALRDDLARIEFEKETLPNGLDVIYAPLHTAPVVHVRVLYHVGSRDERPDRQGFAHMFEHMMFRGSAHIAPEQHMKLIGVVGGNSNAFTSFDQTTYVNTLPSSSTEMALYLEADRMASFKVSDTIFQTERKVVSEEWRMRYGNQPLGSLFQDFLRTAYTAHSYRWTPIGDMDQLRQARSSELQEFFNKYYVPNNACLILAGDIDTAKAKEWVRKYFGWMPRGSELDRQIPKEPEQTESRRLIVYKPSVPLTNIYLGFKTTDYVSDDHYALDLLGDILSSGRTGRLDRDFVLGDSPTCINVGAGDERLEDLSLFLINAVVQPGKDPDKVEAGLLAALKEVADKGVTEQELEKVKTEAKQSIIRGRETCTQIATQLGEAEVFGRDAGRVNVELPKLLAVTPADIRAVAQKYLTPQRLTVVHYRPDPTGANARKAAATQAAAAAAKAEETKNAPVVQSEKPIEPRVHEFPPGYPTEPPMNNVAAKVTFEKGVETHVGTVQVITMPDHRLPLVNFSLVLRGGGDAEPHGKEGLASMTAGMMRRGSAGAPFLDFSGDLESRGISIEVGDGGDITRIGGACSADQIDYAIDRANVVLTRPDFPAAEFEKLKAQTAGGLMQGLSQPATVAEREYSHALYPSSPQGRLTTPQSLQSITLDDVKHWYEVVYRPENATLVISGDITPERGAEMAAKLLQGFARPGQAPAADYSGAKGAMPGRVVLVDNPEGKQATIRLGLRAYDIRTDDKFPGQRCRTDPFGGDRVASEPLRPG